MKPSETPDTVHGRLLESVHFSGYSFERACGELEWLLEGDRWKQVGPGYDDIHAFMQTVDLSDFTLAIEQRKKLAGRLQELKASQRATARMLGVDEGTIRGDLRTHSPAEHSAVTTRETVKPSTNSDVIAEPAEHSATAAVLAEPASRLAVHFSSETPEHYTPQDFLESVHAVFGDIPDLDPCSNSHDHANVKAHTHYTAADNGLAKPWTGRVFLNPPYGREMPLWMEKLRVEWDRGEMSEVIALLPSRTDTEWFNTLTKETDDAVICFLYGRLTFVGNNDPAPFPSMAVYFGPHQDVFARVFINLGGLWQRPGSPLEWFVGDPEEYRAGKV